MSVEAGHGWKSASGPHGQYLYQLPASTSSKDSFGTMPEGQHDYTNDNPQTITNHLLDWQGRPPTVVYPDHNGSHSLRHLRDLEGLHHPSRGTTPTFVRRDAPTSRRGLPPLSFNRAFESIMNADPATTPAQLALPPVTIHQPGDGLDFRRPITGNGEARPRQSQVVDLTSDDDGLGVTRGTDTADLNLPAPGRMSSTRRQGLPRFGRDIIDVEVGDGPGRPASMTDPHWFGWPNSMPNSRQPTPPADDGDEVFITHARPLQSVMHRRLSRRSASFQPRSITPYPAGSIDLTVTAYPAGPIDLTEDGDEIVITDARQVEGAGHQGINAGRPGATAGFGTRAAHIADMLRDQPRLLNRVETMGWGHGRPRLVRDHGHIHHHHGHGTARRVGGRAPGLPLRVDQGNMMPIMLDYQRPAWDLEIGPADRPPTPKYSPPPSAATGFTMNPGEDEVVVCPNCGDELAVGGGTWTGTAGDEIKQQIWVVKKCGHAYCGACATYKAPSGSKGKGKGKEKVVDDATPPPLRRCVVEGCGNPAGKGSLIHVYLSQ